MYWDIAFKSLSFLPPEFAHKIVVNLLAYGLNPTNIVNRIPVNASNIKFDNPLGLAAGFDKNAECIKGVLKLGFSHIEIGTVTLNSQFGNPKPRVFRLNKDKAIINRYGFNSKGVEKVKKNLVNNRKSNYIIGVNIGPNKNSEDKILDYFLLTKSLSKFSDYISVNISSPNTIGLRDLQNPIYLKEVINAVKNGQKEASILRPIFLKFSPDMSDKKLLASVELACQNNVNGLILTNTTTNRPKNLLSFNKFQNGGLSGLPLKQIATKKLSLVNNFLKLSGKKNITLIGVGGIEEAKDVYTKILVGADLTQLYTAIVFKGPKIVNKIMIDLKNILDFEGINSFDEIKGSYQSHEKAEKHANKIVNYIINNN